MFDMASYQNVDDYFFTKMCTPNLSDCLPFALNFYLRFPFFTRKEQSIRLMKRNQFLTDEKAKEQKRQGGFKIANFRDFAIYCNER